MFVAEPAGNFVRRIVLDDDGTTLRARNAYDKAEFFGSTDERFRPVFISNAPDGTLMVVDFYRGVIQDRASTTLYLRDYIQKRKLDAPTGVGRGRVFRVVHESVQRDTTRPQLSRATPAQLVETLSHPNGWWRDTAQRLLVERSGVKAVPELKALAAGTAPPRTRVKALWVLDGNDNIDVATVDQGADGSARATCARPPCASPSDGWAMTNSPIQAAVLKLIDDPDWQVREQVAASLGAMATGPKETAIASLLQKHADDPVAMDAALSGARGSEPAILEKLLQSDAPQTAAHEAAIVMVSATIIRAGQDASVQTTLAMVADANRPAWQRSAVLRGAEVALVPNTPMPGTARRGLAPSITATAAAHAGAPCPTCPGGRAGPGGAYAFDDARGSRRAGHAEAGAERGPGGRGTAGGRGRGGPRLQIAREPAAFSALAGGSDTLASRAANVLARIEWPGKPGAANPVTPLTAAEQQRFEAGREVYRNICQACHQPDGRGLVRVAPPLVGSMLALAPRGRHGANSPERQGRPRRLDAADRRDAHRRSDRECADLRATRVGTGGRSRRSGHRRDRARTDRRLAPGRGPTTSC